MALVPGHVAVTEQTVNAHRNLVEKMEWNMDTWKMKEKTVS